MKEVPLLVDATNRLTEPFLLVIVGEFNSGKSTVINALLGRRYLTEGVVPTTNEITLLCYSENESDKQERCERHPDEQFIICLSAPILKEMNLVDTPGTNVILQRQQRLTEEFVPRADLILFVLSSDRPLTESEVSFLLYTQQWKKKVVFVLNKMDLYRSTSELEEASSFIKENTKKILNSEDIGLYPVSARAALDAKLFALYYDGRNFEELLSNDPRWLASGFDELEKYLFSFLDGSTHAGSERLMLKLKTPMAIADRLLHSCEVSVKQELENASQDWVSIKEAVTSVKERAMKLESETILWRKQALSLVDKAKARVIELVETTLQLSKVDLISTYGFKGERSGSIPATSVVENDIIGPAVSDALGLLGEYSMWLQLQTAKEGKLYIEFFDQKWQAFINEMNCVHLDTYLILDKGDEQSIKVVENFSASAAARLFEQEIREAVLGTFGGLGAAGLSASLLTSVLPTTLEDLLALAFCSAGGFLAISNFPARRKEAIEKVRRVADGLARDIDDAMQKDLAQATDKLAQFVEVISKPYQDAAQDNVNRLLEIQEELGSIEQKMWAMKVRIQSLNDS
ncbi:Dynamin GTPase protein [Dioscorea alata]|nr:Dynamin GTPase protein [Dioscorea alata]